MLNRQEFLSLRNNTIISLYNKSKLRYTEIANLQVQDIDNNRFMVRIQRGDRIFRVALSPVITENMKLLIGDKEETDYIFNSKKGNNVPLSRTMITKIIENTKYTTFENTKVHTDINNIYSIKLVDCDYKILKNDKMVEGLSLNNKVNAIKIVDILNADNQIK